MIKYLRLIFGFLPYVIWTYPRMRYYAKHIDTVPYEKRFELHKKIFNLLFKMARVKPKIVGLEKIPDGNKIAFCPNHQSYADPTFIMFDQKHNINPLAKVEISHIPFFGKIVAALGAVFINREDLRDSYRATKEIQNIVANDGNVLVYLEGTRSKHKDHHMNEIKSTAVKSLMQVKATIQPVFLWDFFGIFDIHDKRKNYEVYVEFLDPIRYEDYKDLNQFELSKKLFDILNEKVQSRIEKNEQ